MQVAVAAVGLAVVSLLTDLNWGDDLALFRLTVTRLANSGTAWAGLLVFAGWLVRRPLAAAAAGLVAGQLSLVAHYALGRAVGLYTSEIWAANVDWFILTLVAGPLLGLVGSAARRADRLGLVAKLAVPAGALGEPFARGLFVTDEIYAGPYQSAGVICGAILLTAGAAGAASVLLRSRQTPPTEREPEFDHRPEGTRVR